MKSFTPETARSLLRGNIAAIAVIVAMCELIVMLTDFTIIWKSNYEYSDKWMYGLILLGVSLFIGVSFVFHKKTQTGYEVWKH